MAPAAAVSAADQVVSINSSPWRTSGAPMRSGLLTASKPKRPLSQSQPQFTASASTP